MISHILVTGSNHTQLLGVCLDDVAVFLSELILQMAKGCAHVNVKNCYVIVIVVTTT